ncbi:MAG: LuxR C-terminal-related transcriptional regulator [Muribaculaceae bacterium]|nr:LuxR C-terminal-related transcriptional regulator [Muribaculaceae bacterium]
MEKSLRLLAAIITVFIFAPGLQLFGSVPKVLQIDHDDVESGFQDLAIAQDSLHRIYVGNQEGLLRFDGEQWQGFYLPNQSAIRAVHCKNDTVFVGGFDEFGYFLPLYPGGPVVYASLSDALKSSINNITEIRDVKVRGNELWFRADYWLFEYSGGRVRSYPSRRKLTAMAFYGGRTVLATGDSGLCIFSNGQFEELPAPSLEGKYVVDMVPFNGKLLIVTANDGLYLMDGHNSIERYNTAADSFMERGNIFSVAADGSRLAFASLSKGLCTLDSPTGRTTVFNTHNGLESNTVYSLFFDANHNLWAGTDDGLALIVLNSPVAHLSVRDRKLGIGYAALEIDENIVLGTSQGLFYIDKDQEVRPMQQLRDYQPPVMCLALIGDELFVGTNDGLHILGKNGSKKIAGVPATLCIKQLHSDPNAILLSTNDNFYLLEREGSRWRSKGKVSGYSDVNGRFAEDALGNIWISHWLKGVFRLRLAPDRTHFNRVDLLDMSHGFPDNAGNTLAEIDGRVVFSTRHGIYSYDASKGLFAPDTQLNQLIPHNPSAMLFMSHDRTILSISPENVMVSKIDSAGERATDSTSFKSVLPDLVPGYVEMLPLNSGEMLLSSRHGFYSLDPRFRPLESADGQRLLIDRISTPADSVLYRLSVGARDSIHIEYANNSLKFAVALPEFRGTDIVQYSFFLKGYDSNWSLPGIQSTKEYTKLPEGNYTLCVKAFDTYDDREYLTEFHFTIDAPWYRTTLAKTVYALLIILLLVGIGFLTRHISLRAARKVKEREEERFRRVQQEAEVRMLKDQYELEKVKTEQMEYNIRIKSEELSNTTMNVIRKNELLNSIIYKIRKTEEILGEKGYNTEVKKNLNNLRRLIADNIEHDDDWKNFTDNFDVVYNNFTQRLTEKFPTLTKSEVKICCYIKMGLSSKEISSIFNLSVRSIEMYRYQIRPKLGLGREDRLSVFLQQF